VWYIWEERQMYAVFLLENLKAEDHLEDLGMDE
jgi:hypothetical protein